MKKFILYSLIIPFAGIINFLSCKKEHSCEGCINGNRPPIAIAGPDQAINLPTDSVSLDGSASNDPDGMISEWLWTRISGPASFDISNVSVSTTVVKNLVVGTYQFELKVKDDKGLTAKDTIQISVIDPTQPNQPPVANAGPDQTVTLPIAAISLDGSASTDPDNNITSYLWTQVSGPISFSITNTNSSQTLVTNLVQGIYQFELKVTDGGGLFSKDTVQVTVNNSPPPPPSITCDPLNRPTINAQLIPLGNLSQARTAIATASAGNKIFFAGGYNGSPSSRVDIYNITTQNWSTAELSMPRRGLTAVASGNKVFFAGGLGGLGIASRIDIYDLSTQTWSITELPHDLDGIVSAGVGNKILFAGGFSDELIVDAYDISTNSWSTKNLGRMRYGLSANTAGNKAYFAGGCYNDNGDVSPCLNRIDIYDDATGSWTTSALNTARAFMTSIVKNGKIYWAGGAAFYDWSYEGSARVICQIEIKDVNTQTTTFANLSSPEFWDDYGDPGAWNRKGLEKGNKIVFVNGTDANYDPTPWLMNPDIYDITTNSWSLGVLNPALTFLPVAYISNNNTIYVAGGLVNNGGSYSVQVWKLEF